MSTTPTTELKRGLAAVMFTDMAGYTALMQRDEAAALRSRERHRRALERSVRSRDGQVLQYFGDGSLSIFRSSLEAVQGAIEIQRELGGRQHNDVIGCQVVDPAEEELPPGRYPISDGRHTSMLDTTLESGRHRFEAMSRRHSLDPRRVFQRHQCGWVVMHSNDDPVEVLGRDLRVLVGRAA